MAHVNGQIFGIWTFSVIRRGVRSLDEMTSEPTLGWRRSRLALESSGKSYRNVTKFSFSPLLTLSDFWQSNKPSVRLCASIRESVCECVCVVVHVCPHTYTNCGVSYIRGTLTPFFCVKSKERKIKSDFYFNNNLASSFNPRPKTPLKKQNKKTTEKNTMLVVQHGRLKPEQNRAGFPETWNTFQQNQFPTGQIGSPFVLHLFSNSLNSDLVGSRFSWSIDAVL